MIVSVAFVAIIAICLAILSYYYYQIRRVYRRDPGRIIQIKFNYETNLHEISDAVWILFTLKNKYCKLPKRGTPNSAQRFWTQRKCNYCEF